MRGHCFAQAGAGGGGELAGAADQGEVPQDQDLQRQHCGDHGGQAHGAGAGLAFGFGDGGVKEVGDGAAAQGVAEDEFAAGFLQDRFDALGGVEAAVIGLLGGGEGVESRQALAFLAVGQFGEQPGERARQAGAVHGGAGEEADAVAGLAGDGVLRAIGEGGVGGKRGEIDEGQDGVDRAGDVGGGRGQRGQGEPRLGGAVGGGVGVFGVAFDGGAAGGLAGAVEMRGDVTGGGLGEDGDGVCDTLGDQRGFGGGGGVAFVVGVIELIGAADTGGVDTEKREQRLRLAVLRQGQDPHFSVQRQVRFADAAGGDVRVAVIGGERAVPGDLRRVGEAGGREG